MMHVPLLPGGILNENSPEEKVAVAFSPDFMEKCNGIIFAGIVISV